MKVTEDAKRRYESPIRVAQAAQTRERIVAAAHKLLEQGNTASLTLPRVARSAVVSVPTVYLHFPTLDALFLEVAESLAVRLGVPGGGSAEDLAGLVHLPAQNFPLFERNRNALRAFLASPAAKHLARTWAPDLQPQWVALVQEATPNLSEGQRKARAALLSSLWSPVHWHWLTETCGLSAEEAVESAAWAIGVLTGALSAGVDFPSGRMEETADSEAAGSKQEEPEPTPSWLL